MQKILLQIARTGIISERAPAADESLRQIAGRLNDEVLKLLEPLQQRRDPRPA